MSRELVRRGGVTPPAKNQPASRAASSPLYRRSPSHAEAPSSPKASGARPRLVGRRVDALVLGFQVTLDPSVRDELAARQALAEIAGVAELRFEDLVFALKRTRRVAAFPFANADVRCLYDEKGCAGWNLEVVVCAAFLATHPLQVATDLARQVAAAFGRVKGCRLRRFDLCADFTGFPIARDDVERLVTTRTRVDGFLTVDAKDVDEAVGELCKSEVREHRGRCLEVTGITVGAGNPVMARIYDKSAELALSGREEKRHIEYAGWRGNGWDGSEQVTRVEFQHRSEFLDEVGLRNVDHLQARMDAVWQRDVVWLRIVDTGTASRRVRCALDPRWVAVRLTIFEHEASPVARSRALRGGARPSHVLGALVSRLAASGKLTRLDFGITPDGEVLDETTLAEHLGPAEAEQWVERELARLGRIGAADLATFLLLQHGPSAAVQMLAAKINAAAARFSSVDDGVRLRGLR